MSANVKVSVIVPAYNAAKTLEKSVHSIMAQTVPELEVILVDDGSTDATGALADGLAAEDSRIRVVHKANGGVSAARNEALRLAAGQWVTFVDADDWIEPDFLESLLQAPSCDLAVGGYRVTGAHEIREENYEDSFAGTAQELKSLLEAHLTDMTFLCPWGKLLRRSIIEEAGLSFPADMSLGEDTVFIWACLAHVRSIALRSGQRYNYLTGTGGVKYAIDADTALSAIGRVFGQLDRLEEKTGMDGEKARNFILRYYIWQFKVNVRRSYSWSDRGRMADFFRTPLIYNYFKANRRQSADKLLVYVLLRLRLSCLLYIIIKLYY